MLARAVATKLVALGKDNTTMLAGEESLVLEHGEGGCLSGSRGLGAAVLEGLGLLG